MVLNYCNLYFPSYGMSLFKIFHKTLIHNSAFNRYMELNFNRISIYQLLELVCLPKGKIIFMDALEIKMLKQIP